MPCPVCGCDAVAGASAHAIQASLHQDDLDGAMAHGLLNPDIDCNACALHCRNALQAARKQRQDALAARERFRKREARLARRSRERDARRKGNVGPAGKPGPGLPPAAAAALARAKAKAAAH